MQHPEPSRGLGIAAAGNWIVDRVKIVDRLPERGLLGSILSETRAPGGSPANVLADLARLQAPFPLFGFGIVGADSDGEFLLESYRKLGVCMKGVRQTPDAPTSYTDVMTEKGTGDRTFYHHRGANALFQPSDVPVETLSCRIFHLGYLLLLDAMDAADSEFGTVAARLLYEVRRRGIRTSVDVVSEAGDRFRLLVPPALAHCDYVICNEIEAGRAVGVDVRDRTGRLDTAALREATHRLGTLGDMDLVAVHMPEGAVVRTRDGRCRAYGSLQLPDGYIRSAVGAGDAFCAGMLFGLHEGWPVDDCVRLAQCAAAASLAAEGASDGVLPLHQTLALADRFPSRPPPL